MFKFWRFLTVHIQVTMLRSANLPNMEEGLARFAIEVSGHKEFSSRQGFAPLQPVIPTRGCLKAFLYEGAQNFEVLSNIQN